MRQRLAIIGTGIAGLGAAHFLQKRFELTLFEKNSYVGGHTATVTFQEGNREQPVDTGFMVYNEVTYPNLTRLFRELGVETRSTDMSFSVRHVPLELEYSGGSLSLLFGQRRNLWNLRFWRMLVQIRRFNEEAYASLQNPEVSTWTLREFVERRGYGADFLHLYLIPMGGAVWSTPPDRMLEFPAATLIRFWHNHGFLGLHTQHPWRTLVNGARSYVEKLTAPFRERIEVGRAVCGVNRSVTPGKVRVFHEGGSWSEFDKVILACHGDQALGLLQDPTVLEVRLLEKFRYESNQVCLHTDSGVMPRTRRCWSSWNYRMDLGENGSVLPTTHYWMNSLQSVSEKQDYFVSLNAEHVIAPQKILRRFVYEHPLFDCAAVAAQKELPELNRLGPDQTTYYCGAWFKYGFHEDGFTSGLECARAITGEAFWS